MRQSAWIDVGFVLTSDLFGAYRAIGMEMTDNYYYLRKEYTRCRISRPAVGEISLGDRLSRIERGTRVFAGNEPASGSPPSDPSHRANYLITAADQSSGLIEGSLFSGHHCDEFAPPVVIGNYVRFNFSNNDESLIASYLTNGCFVWPGILTGALSPDSLLKNTCFCAV